MWQLHDAEACWCVEEWYACLGGDGVGRNRCACIIEYFIHPVILFPEGLALPGLTYAETVGELRARPSPKSYFSWGNPTTRDFFLTLCDYILASLHIYPFPFTYFASSSECSPLQEPLWVKLQRSNSPSRLEPERCRLGQKFPKGLQWVLVANSSQK